ncbi:hypothetical protein [Fimbriiglobus ruber]|uniref:hypothetical protein n=1 Tax=Fimbriiglobus ruber TaxID=1908690 RepID=UPI00117B37C7|nr:hypothetical protein [Fimbriiglobus ruber]
MRSLHVLFLCALGVAWGGLFATPAISAEVPGDTAAALKSIKAVSREGAGNEAAAAAWKTLVAGGTVALFQTLTAFDGADPKAANWLRAAVDAIAEGEHRAKRKLPVDKLESFVNDTARAPAARRIAFELLTEEAPAAATKLLPTLINDPSRDLRRDAIAVRLKAAKESDTAELKALFEAAREKDQAEELAALLEKLGISRTSPNTSGT